MQCLRHFFSFVCFSVVPVLALSSCASSVPANFEYKTSLRGEQGFIGRAERVEAAETLLAGGMVTDPALALRTALPTAEIRVRKWGLRYISKDWSRYQVVMDADIQRGDTVIRCRESSTENPATAPTLEELKARDGAELQRQLDTLVSACLRQAKDLT